MFLKSVSQYTCVQLFTQDKIYNILYFKTHQIQKIGHRNNLKGKL